MSKIRSIYMIRLIIRCIILIASIVIFIFNHSFFDIVFGWNFFDKFSALHLLWFVWILDMIHQLFPIRGYISLGSQKHFLQRFKPIKERINYEALRKYIISTTKSAYKVFFLWGTLILLIGILYWTDIINKSHIFLISIVFYVCDLICVLIWCPFRLIMKNRCCTTCRIYNWDHLMMFSPFIFIPGVYTTSLLLLAIAVWILWELCVMLYPERFWQLTNDALKCSNCTDKLCTQYCKTMQAHQDEVKTIQEGLEFIEEKIESIESKINKK